MGVRCVHTREAGVFTPVRQMQKSEEDDPEREGCVLQREQGSGELLGW